MGLPAGTATQTVDLADGGAYELVAAGSSAQRDARNLL